MQPRHLPVPKAAIQAFHNSPLLQSASSKVQAVVQWCGYKLVGLVWFVWCAIWNGFPRLGHICRNPTQEVSKKMNRKKQNIKENYANKNWGSSALDHVEADGKQRIYFNYTTTTCELYFHCKYAHLLTNLWVQQKTNPMQTFGTSQVPGVLMYMRETGRAWNTHFQNTHNVNQRNKTFINKLCVQNDITNKISTLFLPAHYHGMITMI